MVNDLSLIKNKKALAWIKEQIALCTPDKVHVMDGSIEEIRELNELLVKKGTFIRLNPEKRPNCFYTRTNPGKIQNNNNINNNNKFENKNIVWSDKKKKKKIRNKN